MPKYTFIVCARCGVQSQPLLIDIGTFSLQERLQLMGWAQDKKDKGAYYCPVCRAWQEKNELKEAI